MIPSHITVTDRNDPGVEAWFNDLVAGYPPHDVYGIDFANAVDCPIVTVTAWHGDHVLLTKRSNEVIEYPGAWALIGGFMPKPSAAEVALEELVEEAGIGSDSVLSMHVARWRMRLDPAMRVDAEFSAPWRRRWFEFRVSVELREQVRPTGNWENERIAWMTVEEALALPMLPSSQRTLRAWNVQRLAAA